MNERERVWSRVRGALAHAISRGCDEFRRRPWRTLEIGLGVLVLAFLGTEGRTILRVCGTVMLDAATAVGPLLRADGAATAGSLGLGLGRIGLAALPSVMLIRSVPRHRWLWLIPLLALLITASAPISLAACATIDRWVLLAFLSVAATALSSVRFFRWTVVLPFAVLLEVVPSHGLLDFADVGTRDRAYRERLLTECARHEGTRPQNLTADRLMPYHGISSLGDDLVLLAGEGPNDGGMRGNSDGRRVGSWWMRRKNGEFQFELPSEANGNLWRGCVIDGTIWMGRAGRVVGAQRLPEGGPAHERVYQLSVPSSDMDLLDTGCDPDRGRIYVGEFFNGGLLEVAPDNREARRHDIGGVLLLPKRRFDGRLIVTSTASLMVFAPGDDQIVERVPARLVGHGFDLCGVDGAAAVADMSGRLRVFEIDGAGHYRFAWGVSLFAPRRVAYSPDCSRIAVTSADDHRVFIIDALAHRVVDVFRAGPALREVASTGPREFSVSDVCSMTTYRW